MAEKEIEHEAESEDSEDLYAVLGLNKECSAADLKSAYKKLALVILTIQSLFFSSRTLVLNMFSLFDGRNGIRIDAPRRRRGRKSSRRSKTPIPVID